ncbi:MAG: SsrA-binding protein [Alphaproteobacteria bacterium]|nr:MAG: SsrA-binding protein [Alphaproteobacteria bacterium]
MAKNDKSNSGMLTKNATIAHNRRVKFDYELLDIFDAGIVLVGSEVKSLRQGKVSINEAYVREQNDEIFLVNANIEEYSKAKGYFKHETARPRKLLLNRKEINKLLGGVRKNALTMVPIKLYFDAQGRAKISIALARGKKLHDKRATEKNRDWGRQKARVIKEHS